MSNLPTVEEIIADRKKHGWLSQIPSEPAITALLAEIERLNNEAAETRRLSLELYTATTGPAVHRAGK